MPNCEVAYPPVELKNVLGEYLSKNGKTQLRIAETEKYAHVTFFFNGGVEAPYEGEDRKVVPSPKVATLRPEARDERPSRWPAECKARIESGKYDVIILNFANCDMVGHTGVFEAAVKAVEAVDARPWARWWTAALARWRRGLPDRRPRQRREDWRTRTAAPSPLHTTNAVPFAVIGAGDVKLREGGCLADYRPHHAALYRAARAGGDDRQEHHRGLIPVQQRAAAQTVQRSFFVKFCTGACAFPENRI